MEQAPQGVSHTEEQLAIRVDRVIYAFAHRWITYLIALSAIFVALPFLAPFLMSHGYILMASWIYRAFSLICHQRPDRSFHVFDHQVAYCHRDLAIYSGFFLCCIAYALLRDRMKPLSLRGAILFSIPMAIDGFSQLFGLRESTWELRFLTGGLFAIGVAWLILPRLEIGFTEIRRMLEQRFARLALEGHARPL